MRILRFSICLSVVLAIFSCREKQQEINIERSGIEFTKEDSLTDRYLVLQDSLLRAWNLLITDDNRKIKALHQLLHELTIGKQAEESALAVLAHRLEQLNRIRFTQKTMANPDVVAEYDFASNSLVTELLSLALTSPAYEQNPVLQSLVEEARMADNHALFLRQNYDGIAMTYNAFLRQHGATLTAIDETCIVESKPLFELVEDN